MSSPLGPRHGEVKRLRALLRDPRARSTEAAFVLEGPRIIEGALDRQAVLESVYLGPGADVAFAPLVARLRAAGTPVTVLAEGVLEKLGTTRTPQPVLAVAPSVVQRLHVVPGRRPVVAAVEISDPGNLGTIIRCAEAAGADAVIVCGNSVDAQNPKVVRSSSGAVFGLTVMETPDPMEALASLAEVGRPRLGTLPSGAPSYTEADLSGVVAFVLGNEARGLPPEVQAELDGNVTIPMTAGAESLNVAMAATVLLFEAARQRAQVA